MSSHPIILTLKHDDITTVDADVVALKYAQEFYGADGAVASRLENAGISVDRLQPARGAYSLVDTNAAIAARQVLYVGTPILLFFRYQEIREFSERVLALLTSDAPDTRHLAMTIHGVGYGLDEVESLLAQVAGCLDALQAGTVPPRLERIAIVERNEDRVRRLRAGLDAAVEEIDYVHKTDGSYLLDVSRLKGSDTHVRAYRRGSKRRRSHPPVVAQGESSLETAGRISDEKPHVFVAMPFKKEMDDIFYYGIQNPVRNQGLICERVDQDPFVGDIMSEVKKRIETAEVIIADLTGANPNVYLEVGYAWGKSRPTILLANKMQELKFDVRGQRCLMYESIRELEEALTEELDGLVEKGVIRV